MKDFIIGVMDIIVLVIACIVLATGVLSGGVVYGVIGAIIGAFGSAIIVSVIFGYWVVLSSINENIKKLVDSNTLPK
jgi:hypothetical protein